MGAAAAVIIIKKEKHLVAHFKQARAVSLTTAKSLSALRVHEGIALRRLRNRAVIREAAPGTFYLDEPSWLALRRLRRRLILMVLVIAAMISVAMAFSARA